MFLLVLKILFFSLRHVRWHVSFALLRFCAFQASLTRWFRRVIFKLPGLVFIIKFHASWYCDLVCNRVEAFPSFVFIGIPNHYHPSCLWVRVIMPRSFSFPHLWRNINVTWISKYSDIRQVRDLLVPFFIGCWFIKKSVRRSIFKIYKTFCS